MKSNTIWHYVTCKLSKRTLIFSKIKRRERVLQQGRNEDPWMIFVVLSNQEDYIYPIMLF
jgi:hypothetical protein